MPNVFLCTYPVSGEQRIAEWSLDTSEAFCAQPPLGGGEASGLVIHPDTRQCNIHWPDPSGPCVAGYRSPPECQHEPNRVTPADAQGLLSCLDCGAQGRDVTDDWRERLRGTAGPLVSPEGGSEVHADLPDTSNPS